MNLELNTLNYRYLLNTRRFALLALGVVALGVGLFFLVIVPQFQAGMEIWGRLSKEQKVLAQLQKKDSELSDFANSPMLVKSAQVDLLLPGRKPLLELLTGLYQVATVNQVNFTDVELSPGKIASDSASPVTRNTQAGSKDYDSIDVALTVQGDLVQLNRFFDALENLAPLSIITNLSLNQSRTVNTVGSRATTSPAAAEAANSNTGRFEADLVITTYFYNKSVSAAIQTPLPPIGAAEEALVAKLDGFTYVTLQPQLSITGGGQTNLFNTSDNQGVTGTNLFEALQQIATESATTP